MSGTGLYTTDELYRLLPEVYRVRDAEQNGVLRELIDLLAGQVNVLAESVEQAYDDQFIETCAAWVAPYIGDLVGYRTLNGIVPQVASPRAEVANTIRYRRRKGTVTVLEELGRDVTGWPAHAVEYFRLLVTSQYMNHVRSQANATADLRSALDLELAGGFQAGAFDRFAHTGEMRSVVSRSGRYGIQNIGIFLWRVASLPLTAPLVAADGSGRRFRFDQLGTDKPLFADPRTETDVTHATEPLDLPLPLLRRFAQANLDSLYGAGLSLLLGSESGGVVSPLAVADVRICDLSDDPSTPGTWAHEPQTGDTRVAVDPVLGRVAYAAAPDPDETREATFHYGSALAVGGGGYERSSSLASATNVATAQDGEPLGAKLSSVAGGGMLEILDSSPYAAPPSISATTPGSADLSLDVQSANRARPLLSRNGQLKLDMEPNTTVVLNGLMLAGAPLVIEEFADTEPRNLILRHCTLVPGLTRDPDGSAHSVGSASLIVLHQFANVTLDHCIVGPVVAVEGVELAANDSVLDASTQDEIAFCGRAAVGGGGLLTVSTAADRKTGDGLTEGGHLTLDACTVLGKVHARQLDVSDSLLLATLADGGDTWPAPVWAERRQVGCVRFSFVPPGSRTPRKFRCAGNAPAERTFHTSLRFGDPGYMQLRRSTNDAVRTGASDESEMGVTHELYAPQREGNLRIRLDEYLRFGLEAGIFYAT